MALSLRADTSELLTPQEALALAGETITACDFDSLAENAWILKALANNPSFLPKILNKDIESAIAGNQTHIYTHQCLVLAQDEHVVLRANFWVTPTKYAERSDMEKELYSYEVAHDHNFDFVTVGYLGPGYVTDIYRYNRDLVKGFVGERVDLDFAETTRLEAGKMLAFQGGRDVHIQYYPPEFSISLNLMLRDRQQQGKPQYYFDLDERRISGFVENALTSRFSILRFAKYAGDAETLDLLGDMRTKLDQPLLRAAAYDALIEAADAEGREKLEFEIARDQDEFLRERIEQIRAFRP